MKPHFDSEFTECIRESKDNNILFNCYIEWISDFLFNLGINTEKIVEDKKNYFKFKNCPWLR